MFYVVVGYDFSLEVSFEWVRYDVISIFYSSCFLSILLKFIYWDLTPFYGNIGVSPSLFSFS